MVNLLLSPKSRQVKALKQKQLVDAYGSCLLESSWTLGCKVGRNIHHEGTHPVWLSSEGYYRAQCML